MSTRANIIRTNGLETFGSELSRSEGSLKKATNVNVDEKGVITPRRGFADYGNPTNDVESAPDVIKQMMEYKNRIIRHYSDKLEFEDENGSFQAISGSFNTIEDNTRIKYQESNGNLYFTTSDGIKKVSKNSSSQLNSTSTVNVENAGIEKASYIEARSIPTIGGFLQAQSKVAYRYIYGKKDENENLLLGSPSSRALTTNFAEQTNISEISLVEITDATTINNEDYFILYTNSVNYGLYFRTGATANPPKKADTVGLSMIEVDINGFTSGGNEADIAAILANEIANNITEVNVEVDSINPEIVRITNTEGGDVQDITIGTGTSGSGFTVTTSTEGSLAEGNSANVELTLVIPSTLDETYFVQVYRTAPIEASEGQDINNIDPGDEMNLVYEQGLTAAEISAGELTFTDNLPETFRSSAVPLYTNAITGEGILQANDQPPIALDLFLFRNSMFYANTKTKHRLELDLLSVDDFITDSTIFVVGNEDVTRHYTFVGTAQDITLDIPSPIPVGGEYFTIDSANNDRSYYFWFFDGTGTDPEIAGKIGIRVDIEAATTQDDVADAILSAASGNIDFLIETNNNNFSTSSTVGANQVRFLYSNNGYTNGFTDVDSGLTVASSTPGTGELVDTDEGGDVLLSGLISVGQAIAETSRSLVKVINQDDSSPINAFYVSNDESLPGQMLLENKNQEDKPFYVSIIEPSNDQIGKEFSSEIPYAKEIERIRGLGLTTEITLTGHGYANGQSVFVSYNKDPGTPSDPSSFSGVYTISNVSANTFEIEEANIVSVDLNPPTFTTAVFLPNTVSDNVVAPNRLYFSKFNEPEAVPFTNFVNVGPRDEPIRRILALRDNLYVLKDDGVYIVTGTSAPNFSVRLIDNTRILAPDSAVVLNNRIFCLTEQGIAQVADSGVGIISRGIENRIDDVVNSGYDYEPNTFGIPYENDRAYILFTPQNDADTSATQAFRYNIFERTWTRWEYSATSGVVLERDNKLYLGSGDRNYTVQERKNNDRTDYADRDFTASFNSNPIRENNQVEVSSLLNIETNDVVTQTQVVTISYFNRLLRKMDVFDNGLTPPSGSSFVDTYSVSTGDNMPSKVQALNDYLVGLDAINISSKSIDQNNLKESMETLVTELNDPATVTSIKTYKNPTTITFEAYITGKDVVFNLIQTHIQRPWLEGEITIFKHIEKTIQWNPQHFGDPSALKQVREAAIVLDQNNFYEGTMRFGSDVAQNLVDVPANGKGIGYWGDMAWSDPDHYWGGTGNDIPLRRYVPRGKQKCRYLTVEFEHKNAREYFRIVGISAVVRAISSRAYR